jgi:hypothetical protein
LKLKNKSQTEVETEIPTIPYEMDSLHHLDQNTLNSAFLNTKGGYMEQLKLLTIPGEELVKVFKNLIKDKFP